MEGMSGVQKAAILLISLGPEKSATIFKHLKEDEDGIYCCVVGANNKNYDCSKFEKKE